MCVFAVQHVSFEHKLWSFFERYPTSEIQILSSIKNTSKLNVRRTLGKLKVTQNIIT